MKITLLDTGKTDEKFIAEGMEMYRKRLSFYCNFENSYIQASKASPKLPQDQVKLNEATFILKKLKADDVVVLLDERGKQFTSLELASWLEAHMVRGTRNLIFVSGGAYGFHKQVYDRANEMIALSKLTFPHQLARLVFLEQLYRAFTIIRGEPYHNE